MAEEQKKEQAADVITSQNPLEDAIVLLCELEKLISKVNHAMKSSDPVKQDHIPKLLYYFVLCL